MQGGTVVGARRQLLLSLSISAFRFMITYTRRVSVPRRSSYIVERLCVCLHPDLHTSVEGVDPGGCCM